MLSEKNNAVIKAVHDVVRQACQQAGRDLVPILAITKNQSVDHISSLLEAGQRWFGENRVQEALSKWSDLRLKYPDLRLHLTGSLQTNKVRQALALFDVIETVDRPQLVLALSQAWKKEGQRTHKILIQVNTGREPQKNGVWEENLSSLIELCRAHKLPLTGLMCIPPAQEEPTPHFQRLTILARTHGLSDLSMGMSNDYPIAIACGATWVRLGKEYSNLS